MLINALNDYYTCLAKAGKVLPKGYSNVNVDFIIALSEDGKISDIIDYREKEVKILKGGKEKENSKPRKVIMPKRTEKSAIDGNIIEHRPEYIFGLNFKDGAFTTEDGTNKAKKSHKAFVETNLGFIEDIGSPLANAYRNFILNWKPERETENPYLLSLGRELGNRFKNARFAFCLDGYPGELLHDDEGIKSKWDRKIGEFSGGEAGVGQCAVSGKTAEIARLHNKITGVADGATSGNVLIGFDKESFRSYGNSQGTNCSISKIVMDHYTEALNYLLHGDNHKICIGKITVLFFAMSVNPAYENEVMALMFGKTEARDKAETESMLRSIWRNGRKGKLVAEQLSHLKEIDPNVDFYMFGLKPNAARLSIKFIYRKKFADILYNIAEFQRDMQFTEKIKPVSIEDIGGELISPKSSSEKINPALAAKLLESVVHGYRYPPVLLQTIVKRVKTDETDEDLKIRLRRRRIRGGIIKACLNRNYIKEEFGVALDYENKNQAYLCGRLFAVLEKIQNEASGGNLNRTIKDSYFASACSRPSAVFPVLVKLSQNHLTKVQYPVSYSRMIGGIIDGLKGEFPDSLLLDDQGRFIIGYYQQNKTLYSKREDSKDEKKELNLQQEGDEEETEEK